MAKWEKTAYKGVYVGQVKRRAGGGVEPVYMAKIWHNGQSKTVRLGRASDGMTPARANLKKAAYQSGKLALPQDKKRAARAKQDRKQSTAKTLDEIWSLYVREKGNYASLPNDETHYIRRIQPFFGQTKPGDIDIEKLIDFKTALREMRVVMIGAEKKLETAIKRNDKTKIKEAKESISNAPILSKKTQEHIIVLLRKLCRWAKFNLPDQKAARVKWNIKKLPRKKRERMRPDEMARLINACRNYDHIYAGKIILLALFTGARKNELLRLRWEEVDFENAMIGLGVNPLTETTKGGDADLDAIIPMNSAAREILESVPRLHGNPWVFPSPITGAPYVNITKPMNSIKRLAGLPKNFRIMHGQRHVFGTAAGKIGDILSTQNLLKHKQIETSKTYNYPDFEHFAAVSETIARSMLKSTETPPDDGAQIIEIFSKKKLK